MDDENLEIARGLFARVTELIEDAHVIAVDGQSPHLTSDECTLLARRLGEAVQDIAALTAAAAVLARAEGDIAGRNNDRNIR